VGTTRFYKFRQVGDDLAMDNALDALVNSYAIFSGRKNFNDPFDSKIDIVHPTPPEILTLLQRPSIGAHPRTIINNWVSNGAFTPNGAVSLSKFETELSDMFDTYPIYSLSSHNTCNLLWAHYASCHTGFCIELEFAAEQPTKVSYQEHIGSIALLDLLKFNLKLDAGNDLGQRIRDALLIKLKCWSYEREYRWIASNAMGRVAKGQRFIKVNYDPQQVKAVIFGCRMSPRVKTYIYKRLPFSTEFQQAIEMKDRIEIVRFDEHRHL